MSTKTIKIPIERTVTSGNPFAINLLTTSKGGAIGGHFQRYIREGLIVKNFGSQNLTVSINGSENTVPNNTTESLTDQVPAHVSVRPAGDGEIDPDDVELLVIVTQETSNDDGGGVLESIAADVVPMSNTLGALAGQ